MKVKDLNNELFDKILFEIINLKFIEPSELLVEYPDCYPIIAEQLNNEVLKVYEDYYLNGEKELDEEEIEEIYK